MRENPRSLALNPFVGQFRAFLVAFYSEKHFIYVGSA